MAYISKEDSAQIRKALKKAFPEYKFSVRINHSSSLDVTVLQGPNEFNETLTVKNDRYNPENNGTRLKYADIHYSWINEERYGEEAEFHSKVMEIIKTGSDRKWFDESDAMTDYFHTAFFINYSVGDWDRPYVCTKQENAA